MRAPHNYECYVRSAKTFQSHILDCENSVRITTTYEIRITASSRVRKSRYDDLLVFWEFLTQPAPFQILVVIPTSAMKFGFFGSNRKMLNAQESIYEFHSVSMQVFMESRGCRCLRMRLSWILLRRTGSPES